jgi:hypothetical protein
VGARFRRRRESGSSMSGRWPGHCTQRPSWGPCAHTGRVQEDLARAVDAEIALHAFVVGTIRVSTRER